MAPLVSVIMPAYKAEAYIEEAIRSVLAQTHEHWELLVIDDGSPDQSAQKAQSFGDQRIRVISQENAGVSRARNKGLAEAQGDWIAFLDADDIWLPHKLQTQLEAAQALGEPCLVYSDFVVFDEEGAESHPKMMDVFGPEAAQGRVERYLRQHNFIGTLTVMVAAEAIRQVGDFSLELHGPEDWDLWIRLAEAYPLVYVPQILARYRQHAAGISKDYEPYEKNLERVYQTHLLAKGKAEEKRFGMWLFYRHMAHGFARQGKASVAWDRWLKAVKTRPWTLANGTSAAYLLLRFLRR